MVTGASEGIGHEFALQLAQAGFNIVLISRKPSAAAQEISMSLPPFARPLSLTAYVGSATGAKTKFVAMDFSVNDKSTYAQLAEELKDLDIGVLGPS